MRKVTLQRLTCKRCGHGWTPRQTIVRQCPSCKSALFNVKKAS